MSTTPLNLPTADAPPQPLAERAQRSRLSFVDNLRVFIIMIVLAHHSGNPYLPDNDFWYYRTPPGEPHSVLVALFMMLVPSSTMAILLVFSGYLVPPSYDRHGFGVYMREKFVHLGIPLFIGGMIMLPLLQYYSFHMHWGYKGYSSFWEYYWKAWHGLGPKPEGWNGPGWPDRNLAHLWYIEHLLFYALAYGLFRRFLVPAGHAQRHPSKPPGNGAIIGFALAVSLATFVVRWWCPYNKVYALFGFLQIDMSHFPQWLPFFFVGLAAYRYDWLTQIPSKTGRLWLGVAIALAIWNAVSIVIPGHEWFFAREGFQAGPSGPLLYRCIWETFFCVGATVGLIVLFRDLMNLSTPFTRTMASNAYAVHVFHPPMIVALQFAFGGLAIATFFKFVAVSISGWLLCFPASHFIIRRIPFAKRVL